MLERILSFDKPMAPILTRLLYYFALAAIIVKALGRIWNEIWYFLDAPLYSLGQILVVIPITAILAALVVRVVAECILALLRMDKSLHEQVTGRSADALAPEPVPQKTTPKPKPAPKPASEAPKAEVKAETAKTTQSRTTKSADKPAKTQAKRTTRTRKPVDTKPETKPEASPDQSDD